MTDPKPQRTPPRVLTIAGSDSGGGAGIQADLKTFCAHGAYGMSVVTAVTAQNTRAVTAVHPIPPELISAQIEAVLSDIGADAIKIGMLADAAIVRAVAEGLRGHVPAAEARIPIVLDPVMVAKSGDALLADDAVAALRDELIPLATVMTPNLPEAEVLAGRSATSLGDRLELAKALAALGPAVVLKGGHAEDGAGCPSREIEDILCDGSTTETFVHPRIQSSSTHGTGCTLSSAIAARLARGDTVRAAVAGAIEYLQGAIATAFDVGKAAPDRHGPVNHLYRWSVDDG
ncbi:MAG: bifunctional hydroxymethylpyrimidine kinase/phosphomethylpyrimidine kinase [bacterium]|nr:bifunctional hydroxymethylpyrimidine kinase/phosphomethylpyrimidine kinase [bacterium]